jgi:hypothetical protein
VLPPELQVRPGPGSPPASPPKPRSSSGLTAAGVVVVLLAVSLVGLLLDVFTGAGIGWVFGGFFVAACAYVASQVRRGELIWAVIAPPLVFAVLVGVHAMVTAAGGLLGKVAQAMNSLLDYGPMLWVGTAVAAAIVGYRAWQGRRA